MDNRVPRYPGRVKLIPVAGVPDTFDLVRADDPLVEGTPLTKANLLSDETAALLGLPNTAVPDQALAAIPRLIEPIGTIKATTRTDLGPNWLLCNGEKIDATAYPQLAAITPAQGIMGAAWRSFASTPPVEWEAGGYYGWSTAGSGGVLLHYSRNISGPFLDVKIVLSGKFSSYGEPSSPVEYDGSKFYIALRCRSAGDSFATIVFCSETIGGNYVQLGSTTYNDNTAHWGIRLGFTQNYVYLFYRGNVSRILRGAAPTVGWENVSSSQLSYYDHWSTVIQQENQIILHGSGNNASFIYVFRDSTIISVSENAGVGLTAGTIVNDILHWVYSSTLYSYNLNTKTLQSQDIFLPAPLDSPTFPFLFHNNGEFFAGFTCKIADLSGYGSLDEFSFFNIMTGAQSRERIMNPYKIFFDQRTNTVMVSEKTNTRGHSWCFYLQSILPKVTAPDHYNYIKAKE